MHTQRVLYMCVKVTVFARCLNRHASMALVREGGPPLRHQVIARNGWKGARTFSCVIILQLGLLLRTTDNSRTDLLPYVCVPISCHVCYGNFILHDLLPIWPSVGSCWLSLVHGSKWIYPVAFLAQFQVILLRLVVCSHGQGCNDQKCARACFEAQTSALRHHSTVKYLVTGPLSWGYVCYMSQVVLFTSVVSVPQLEFVIPRTQYHTYYFTCPLHTQFS